MAVEGRFSGLLSVEATYRNSPVGHVTTARRTRQARALVKVIRDGLGSIAGAKSHVRSGQVDESSGVGVDQKDSWRKIAITLKIPRVGVQYVEPASPVRKVEFKLTQLMATRMG